MKIADALKAGPCYSFEFFPPRSEEAERNLATAIRELAPLAPAYVSVTYGAGGSTRDRTHDLVVEILRDTGITPMAHLTCACHSRQELVDVVTRYRDAGIENILALGGDPPADSDQPPGELTYASELVDLIRGVGDFSIGVAAHPEPHPHSPSIEEDRRRTAEKLSKADFAVTQFFFDARHYFNLVESLHALGIDKPVIAGIMPATSMRSITRMSELQGSEFPRELAAKLEAAEPDGPEAVHRVGVEEATRLCRELLDGGAPGLHFFTLNRSMATREIYEALGL
ncbi:MAG: methylenetetrahydrofolate reductase [Actinomycetes bacterium]